MKHLYLFIIIFGANSLLSQNVEIQGDATITGQIEVMDTIMFSDGTALASACLQVLQDADQDTKITVEHLPDSDVIHLISQGQTVMIIDSKRLRIIHNGNSMFIGDQAGYKDDGNNGNIFIGNNAGRGNTSGSSNIYIGNGVAQNNQEGTQNVYIGEEAGSEESGANNTFLGALSGFNNLGNQNTMVGHQSGESLAGSGNTVLGASAGANASGDGNVFVGKDAGKSAIGDNQLVIHNTESSNPLISGNFRNQTLSFDANTTIKKDLLLDQEIKLLNLNSDGNEGIKLGVGGQETYGFSTSQIITPQSLVLNKLHLGHIENGVIEKALTIDQFGRVGIGTISPTTELQVSASRLSGHIMKIENTAPGTEGDGLEIKLNRATNGRGNNFVTFKDSDGIAGRIEGFNIGEATEFTSFPNIDFSVYFNPVSINSLAFDPGSLPSFAPGSLPYITGGTLPTLNPGSWPTLYRGTLPSLSGGSFGSVSLSVDFDDLAANLACQANPLCNSFIPWITAGISGASMPTLNQGNLPSLSGGSLPTLNSGSFPTLHQGSLPTLSGFSLPSLNLDAVLNPIPLVTAAVDLKSVMCWALENGERSLLTTNPWDLAMIVSSTYLNDLADCKNGGVTYGSGGADYAEYLLRENFEEHIEEGQIVGVKSGKITKNTEDAEQLLVISMMPIVLGNMPDDTLSLNQYEKVAFLGQAPVWVVGMVRSGDYIIPSGRNDGYGLAVSPNDLKLEHLSQIVGRAWSDGNQAVNMVNMIIGLKTNEMSNILNKQTEEINNLKDRFSKIEAAIGIIANAEGE